MKSLKILFKHEQPDVNSDKICLNCTKKLRHENLGICKAYGYNGNGFFCSLRCGLYFALVIINKMLSADFQAGRKFLENYISKMKEHKK